MPLTEKKGFTLLEAIKVKRAKESRPENFKAVKKFAMSERNYPRIEAEILASRYLLIPELDEVA